MYVNPRSLGHMNKAGLDRAMHAGLRSVFSTDPLSLSPIWGFRTLEEPMTIHQSGDAPALGVASE
jgi:hypothetical protein